MHGVTSHLDEFSLLGHLVGELGEPENRVASAHLAECVACRVVLGQIEELDTGLRKMAKAGSLEAELSLQEFGPGDPFRRRPVPAERRHRPALAAALKASDAGLELCGQVFGAIRDAEQPDVALRELELANPEQRFALYYALQEAARRITESPTQALAIAEAVLRAEKPAVRDEAGSSAEGMLPWLDVRGQAGLLAAQANLWLRDFAKAKSHLAAAYGALARGGDETALAMAELTESQRRFFVGEGQQALTLARRARATFDERGLEDFSARAAVAEGLALAGLGLVEAALPVYRQALPVFERLELWSNYVGAVNSLATALYTLGRLDEARREFARVLRRLSPKQHRSFLGPLRHGLGDLLFAAGRFREAAISFDRAAQLFDDCGLRASALISRLAEAESWARHGSSSLARTRLELAARLLADDPSLDQSAMYPIRAVLSRAVADSDEIAGLRRQVPHLLGRPQR